MHCTTTQCRSWPASARKDGVEAKPHTSPLTYGCHAATSVSTGSILSSSDQPVYCRTRRLQNLMQGSGFKASALNPGCWLRLGDVAVHGSRISTDSEGARQEEIPNASLSAAATVANPQKFEGDSSTSAKQRSVQLLLDKFYSYSSCGPVVRKAWSLCISGYLESGNPNSKQHSLSSYWL